MRIVPSGVDRRTVLAGLAGSAAALGCGPAQAQAKPKRITMVLFRGETEVEQGFRAYVQERGLPFEISVLDTDRKAAATLPGFIEEIRRTRPDLVYTWGTTVTLGIAGTYDQTDRSKLIPEEIPVVCALVADPVGAKIVQKMNVPPGRNLTGVSHIVPLRSQIAAITAYRPFKRLGVIYNPQEQSSVLNVQDLERLAPELGFALTTERVPQNAKGEPDPDAVPGLVDKVAAAGADFLYIGPDTFMGDNRVAVTAEALVKHLPVFTATELEVRTSDTLFGLVSRYDNVGRFAAYKAEQILVKGIPARDIPVETLQRFSYIVNMSVAKRLKLYPPMSVLRFAEVIGV